MAATPPAGHQRPSVAGFADAQDRKRAVLGSSITFLWPKHVTFPPGTALDPNTGHPFDPLASGGSATQASASALGSVFFKAVNRGGAAGADIATQIGHDERTRVFLSLASADGLVVQGSGVTAPASGAASEFVFHGNRFQIYAIKDDEIILGYRRTLIYGAAIGTDTNSGFSP